jgi:hypothetical protein
MSAPDVMRDKYLILVLRYLRLRRLRSGFFISSRIISAIVTFVVTIRRGNRKPFC